MEKYDIRDHYELHNLLKKVIPAGQFPALTFGKMPILTFGTADRASQLFALIMEHAPLSVEELQRYAREEYGFEPGAIIWKDIVDYYHDGVFTIDLPVMQQERKLCLQQHLTEDFYYIDEIKSKYQELFPDGNLEEINSYNLRKMGFTVLSKYAIQHYTTMDAFFHHLLTSNDMVDLVPYRRRFSLTRTFSCVLSDIKRSLQMIEYAPNKLISLRKLEAGGITREDLRAFCDAACDSAPDGTYFTMASLKQDGFESGLFDLGFDDWFYANVLISDPRFSYAMTFGNIVFFKGKAEVTVKAFESSLIRQAGQIDAYDLLALMTERYGCVVKDKLDLVYKVHDTEIYYDRILDRFYANEACYLRDLDRTEDL